ncbi:MULTISPECIES: alpha/beta hydrolase family protein [Chlamydia]|uniref:Phospholipase/Carboxylesterase family protein n=2 Tax=Chlamydia TaxID=810 RepID=A0ABP2X2U1_CHLPS|nr:MULTISPECIES: hydrolase [Chlamydia]AFS19560.1 phospholipase/Carboxylesterase family protein [Chlamydia psittaci 84/55]AFS22751.1 phospholipase/Carboxylesterase family protein [Chlamydia psittaci VS225]AGE75095.1 putative hydrolase [Chlamydia psittaci Mat116]EPJ15604.1 phospholipase/Carboxylesterase family protein [Chlamydia psittaci 02DC18]EPJ16666.1 phospholipase/Carboxylesterase family protein [Chlamydia psittaci 02DC22]EPJ20203.1 phospholipase/Carboxylesterase family protein [Chlamydia 
MEYSFFRRKFAGLDSIVCPGDPDDPIIIFCHGYGANADNLAFFPSACPFKGVRPTWVFPHGIEQLSYEFGGGRAWFPLDVPLFQSLISNPDITPATEEQYQKLFNIDFEKPKAALENLIEELDRPRYDIILGGFSQGAMITTHLILSSKIPYRGALICSGALLLEKGWENNINLCAKVPFIQSHGYQDTILPYYHGERLNQLLSSRLHGEFISFNGGHEIPAVVLQKMQETIPLWTSTFN